MERCFWTYHTADLASTGLKTLLSTKERRARALLLTLGSFTAISAVEVDSEQLGAPGGHILTFSLLTLFGGGELSDVDGTAVDLAFGGGDLFRIGSDADSARSDGYGVLLSAARLDSVGSGADVESGVKEGRDGGLRLDRGSKEEGEDGDGGGKGQHGRVSVRVDCSDGCCVVGSDC